MKRFWQYFVVALALLMTSTTWGATYYVTQAGSGAANGSSYVNAMSVATHNSGTFSGGDTINLCGTITSKLAPPSSGSSWSLPITYRGDCPESAGQIDGGGSLAYGIDPVDGTQFLRFYRIEVRNCTTRGFLLRGVGGVNTGALNNTIDSCTVHDISGGTNPGAIDNKGTGLTVTNSTVYNATGDLIYSEGINAEFSNNTLYNPNHAGFGGGGDCIQVGNSAGLKIHHNTCTMEYPEKHCFIWTNTSAISGAAPVAEYNTCTHPTVNSSYDSKGISAEDYTNGQIIRFNKFTNGREGVSPLGPAQIYYNTFSRSGDATHYAIDWKAESANSTLDVYNNTFYDCYNGIIWSPTATLTLDIKNNIFHTTGKVFYQQGAGSLAALAIDNNDIYTYTTLHNYNYSTYGYGVNNITDNPDLVDPENGNFCPRSGSAVINKGVSVGLTKDIEGKAIANKPDIGACERRSWFWH